MVSALVLLLVALGVVLYLDRDFWFPETSEADDQLRQNSPANDSTATQPTVNRQMGVVAKALPVQNKAERRADKKRAEPQPQLENPTSDAAFDTPFATVAQRTVLPPLEVEVVAGDTHRVIQPESNSVHVDLQPGASRQAISQQTIAQQTIAAPLTPSDPPDSAAVVASNAMERVELSADTSAVVSHSVQPDYPMLARQMKVQGSVILEALISREGRIQNLRVLSGPPILANAAQEAVRQWHFKPHFQGTEMAETQARITVNFTISTN